MIRSSLVKWAVAAMLAVPAASTLASTSRLTTMRHHHRHLTSSHHKHKTLTSISHHHRKLHHKGSSHRSLSSRSHRHTSLSTSAAHPTIKITKMPPTIDGMNT
jgi:hypothetical protein